MATTAFCTSAKLELMQALHNFSSSGGNVFKGLLIKASPALTFGATQTNVGTPGSGTPTTANVGTDETTGTGYVAGGATLTNSGPVLSGTTACNSFSNPSWSSATFSCTAFIVYNSTNGGRSVSVHDLGGTQTVSAGTFTIIMPAQTAGNAIQQIA